MAVADGRTLRRRNHSLFPQPPSQSTYRPDIEPHDLFPVKVDQEVLASSAPSALCPGLRLRELTSPRFDIDRHIINDQGGLTAQGCLLPRTHNRGERPPKLDPADYRLPLACWPHCPSL